jgi:F-type H+-transporting ATPase subunit gamma
LTGPPDFAAVGELADEFLAAYQDGRIGGLEVGYMQFVSPGRQSPSIAPLLPLSDVREASPQHAEADEPVRYDLMPSAHEILERLLPATVRLRLYQCFLDAAVGEQIARITAMRAANKNADEMIHDLTLRYNRLRQSQITTELAEILGGRAR